MTILAISVALVYVVYGKSIPGVQYYILPFYHHYAFLIYGCFFPDMEIWGYPRDPKPQTLANFLASIWACGGYARMGISQMGKWETTPWSVPRSGSILSTKKTQQWAEKPWLILVDEFFIGVIYTMLLCYTLWFIVDHTPRGVHPLLSPAIFRAFAPGCDSLEMGCPKNRRVARFFSGRIFTAMAAMGVPHLQVSVVLHFYRTGASVDTKMFP